MPIYEYTCSNCSAEFELLVNSRGKPKVKCVECGSSKISRKFSLFGAKTKGTHTTGASSSSCSGCTSSSCAGCHSR